MITQRDLLIMFCIGAITALIPSFWVGAGCVGGIVAILVHRQVKRWLLKRAEERALDRALRRWTDLKPERFPRSSEDRKVISLGGRRR